MKAPPAGHYSFAIGFTISPDGKRVACCDLVGAASLDPDFIAQILRHMAGEITARRSSVHPVNPS